MNIHLIIILMKFIIFLYKYFINFFIILNKIYVLYFIILFFRYYNILNIIKGFKKHVLKYFDIITYFYY